MPSRRPLHTRLGTLALLVAAGLAQAQEDGGDAGGPAADGASAQNASAVSLSTDEAQPYYLRVSQGLAHEDNLFRVADSLGTTSDWISSTALLGGFSQPFGRQRGFGSATLRGNSYRDQSQLNNLGYDVALGLDWSTVERISGNLNLNASQSLASFSEFGSADREAIGKNEENSQFYGGRVQYGVTAVWAVDALAEYNRVDFSADEFDNRERSGTTLGAGLRYRPSGIWTFGLGVRRTDGTYPRAAIRNGVTVADDYTSDNVDLTARLNATGLSTFSGRLSYTDEDHDLDTSRDFSGLTGSINWDYQVTGKLGLGLSLSRETGSNTSATSITGTKTFLTDARLTNRAGVNATWSATGKIRLTGGFEFWRDTFDDQFTQVVEGGQTVSSSGETANNYSLRLSARYQPTRTISLECGGRHDDRDSYGRAADPQNGFKVTTLFCNATLTLRG